MKKSLIYIFAAAAMLAGCAKEVINPVEEEIVNIPEGGFSAVFEAPVTTKTVFAGGEGESKYSVLWNDDDEIRINNSIYVVTNLSSDRTKAIFVPKAGYPFAEPNESGDYVAKYGPLDGDGNFALTEQYILPNRINHLPMVGTTSDYKLVFRNTCAVLEVNIPEGASEVKVYGGSTKDEAKAKTNLIACAQTGSDSVKEDLFYVAVEPTTPEGQSTDTPIYLTIAANGKTMTTKAAVSLEANVIYPINFGTVVDITEATTYDLNSYDGDLNLIVRNKIEGEVVIKDTKTRNLYINGGGFEVGTLNVQAPNAHVEVFNGVALSASSITSASTLVLKPDFKITGTLTVSKGAVEVNAAKVGSTEVTVPNVKRIEIPSTATGVKVSVAPVTSNNPDKNKVVIVSKTAQPVEVVGTINEVYVSETPEEGSQNINLVNPVAAIGSTQYSSLKEAVKAAKNGDVVVLRQNVDVAACGIQVTSKNITLDLNGNEIKAGESDATNICIDAGAALTVKDSKTGGKIYSITPYSSENSMGVVDSYGNFTLESGLIEAVLSDPENNGQFGIVAHYGAHVTINGGTVRAGWYALCTNGNDTDENIITVNGGNIISVADYAIYNPAENSQVVINGGVVSGAAGAITLNGGSMIMTNGVMTTKGTGNTGNWSDGTGKLGAAAINVNARYTASSVEISGGQVIAEGTTAVFAVGTTNKATISLTGGIYSADPSAYVAEGYEATEKDGVWTVGKKQDTPAENVIVSQNDFVTACANAVSGDKLVLGAGEFAIGPVDINGKTLTFKGQGAEKTTIYIGNGGYDGNGGHGSSKTANMTFEDLTLDDLASNSGYLTGFTEAAGLTFRNVTFKVGFSNWGNKGGAVSFYNCTFNQNTDGKYNVQELRSANETHYLFDGCTFNSAPGRFINAYKQGGASVSIEIIVKDCSFNGTNQSKAALNLKTGYGDGCNITLYLLGNNTTVNVKNGSKTSNPLFDDNDTHGTVYQGATKETATIIWAKGAKVN